MLNNKTILITGGTGSFGHMFVERVIKNYKPKKLIIFSRDEFKHFKMQKKFPIEKFKFLRFFLGDVRDGKRLDLALKNVDYVIHAAALKHVPIAEYNPTEFIKTNISGAENLIYACINQKVKKIIALSTDKAANPINLYGVTKFTSDKLFVSANSLAGKQNTIFSVVRYGNVLGSRGSVVPLFKFLTKNKEKYLPVTHKDMTRFWITLDQAVDFVLYSLKNMVGGEIFIPKLPSVKILDIVKSLKKDVKIIGIRPGEKIHELMCPNEFYHLTLEFKNHFLILNSLNRKLIKKIELKTNQKSKSVSNNFQYHSGDNKHFLNLEQISEEIRKIEAEDL